MKYYENNKRIMSGSMESICERIATTYIETGRTMRSLAKLYKCSSTTICRYLNEYASDHLNYDLYRAVRYRAKLNREEVYEYGQSENRYSDQVGSLD